MSAAAQPPEATGPAAAWSRFWYGYSVSRARLDVFRVTFFGLMGLNMWLQISHAPRYWAGGFNVSHFPIFDAWLPTGSRHVVLVGWLLQSWLALRIMTGVASRRSTALAALAIGYSAVYYVSQIDSYQHHYLITMILAVTCFVPWGGGDTRERPDDRVYSWGLRLILVECSIVYFWASVAKLDPGWLSGEALYGQISRDWARQFVIDLARALGVAEITGWKLVSWGVIASELFLAIGLHVRKLHAPAFVVGVAMHASIELLGYNIGLFSYFMIGLYLLIAPRWLISALAALFGAIAAPFRALAGLTPAAASIPLLIALGAAGLGLLWALPLPDARWLIPAAALLLAIDEIWATRGRAGPGASETEISASSGRSQRAWAHLAACGIVLSFHPLTDQVRDYYKYLGGDTRRRGEVQEAILAYERVTAVDPSYASGFMRLGDLYVRDDRHAEAAAMYERAEALEPDEVRHPLKAATAWSRAGNGPATRDAAQRVLLLEPRQETALRLLKKWADEP